MTTIVARRRALGAIVGGVTAAWMHDASAAEGVASDALFESRGLSEAERRRLSKGEDVVRAVRFDHRSEEYVGGVGYVIIDAPLGLVIAALMDVSAYLVFMPMTLAAERVDVKGRDLWVYLKHGNSLGEAEYTVRVRRDGGRVIRYWLDPRLPHDIADLWGYWRVQPVGEDRTLLTYTAAMHIGGLLSIFEERIRKRAMTTPKRVRDYCEKKWQALQKRLELGR